MNAWEVCATKRSIFCSTVSWRGRTFFPPIRTTLIGRMSCFYDASAPSLKRKGRLFSSYPVSTEKGAAFLRPLSGTRLMFGNVILLKWG